MTMQHFLVLALVLNTAVLSDASSCDMTDLAKVRTAAKTILVTGAGTALDGTGGYVTDAHIDGLTSVLKVSFDLPATTNGASQNDAVFCNRTWACSAQKFDVCPGEEVTTGQVRRWTTSPDSIKLPTFSFTETSGKKYSLVFYDTLQKGFQLPGYFHWGAFNLKDAAELNGLPGDGSHAKEISAYLAPGNPNYNLNTYFYFLFEHDADIGASFIEDWKETVKTPALKLTDILAAAGLNTAKLVAINWFKAKGSIATRTVLGATGADSFGGTCEHFLECQDCTGHLDMCTPTWEKADCGSKVPNCASVTGDVIPLSNALPGGPSLTSLVFLLGAMSVAQPLL